jgi:DNA invertase Pin-like site-specific DNA recombinase
MKAALAAVLYDRVSTDEEKQDPRGHLAELRAFAEGRGWPVCGEWFDTISGDPARRGAGDPPGLRRALDQLAQLKGGGVLVIREAVRLVRSPIELLQLVARIQATGAHVASRDDGADLDTTTDVGELLIFLRGWMGRMSLKFIRKGTTAALDRRRAEIARAGGFVSRGGVWRTRLGRPSADAAKMAKAIELATGGGMTPGRAARAAGVKESTLRDRLRERAAQVSGALVTENPPSKGEP